MREMFLNKFFNIKKKIILDRLFYQCEEMGDHYNEGNRNRT